MWILPFFKFFTLIFKLKVYTIKLCHYNLYKLIFKWKRVAYRKLDLLNVNTMFSTWNMPGWMWIYILLNTELFRLQQISFICWEHTTDELSRLCNCLSKRPKQLESKTMIEFACFDMSNVGIISFNLWLRLVTQSYRPWYFLIRKKLHPIIVHLYRGLTCISSCLTSNY